MTVYKHAILYEISANIGSMSVSSNSIGSNLIPNLPPAQNSKNQKKMPLDFPGMSNDTDEKWFWFTRKMHGTSWNSNMCESLKWYLIVWVNSIVFHTETQSYFHSIFSNNSLYHSFFKRLQKIVNNTWKRELA